MHWHIEVNFEREANEMMSAKRAREKKPCTQIKYANVKTICY